MQKKQNKIAIHVICECLKKDDYSTLLYMERMRRLSISNTLYDKDGNYSSALSVALDQIENLPISTMVKAIIEWVKEEPKKNNDIESIVSEDAIRACQRYIEHHSESARCFGRENGIRRVRELQRKLQHSPLNVFNILHNFFSGYRLLGRYSRSDSYNKFLAWSISKRRHRRDIFNLLFDGGLSVRNILARLSDCRNGPADQYTYQEKQNEKECFVYDLLSHLVLRDGADQAEDLYGLHAKYKELSDKHKRREFEAINDNKDELFKGDITKLIRGYVICFPGNPLHGKRLLRSYKIDNFGRIIAGETKFNPKKVLGFGSFGKVRSGSYFDNTQLAIKNQIRIRDGVFDREASISNMYHKAIGLACENSQVVSVFEANGKQHLVMPRYKEVLWDVLRKIDEKTIVERCEIAHYLADNVKKMHEEDIVHRDIKPGNILLNDEGCPILVDFSAASTRGEFSEHDFRCDQCSEYRVIKVTKEIGTSNYRLPECLNPGRNFLTSNSGKNLLLCDNFDMMKKADVYATLIVCAKILGCDLMSGIVVKMDGFAQRYLDPLGSEDSVGPAAIGNAIALAFNNNLEKFDLAEFINALSEIKEEKQSAPNALGC